MGRGGPVLGWTHGCPVWVHLSLQTPVCVRPLLSDVQGPVGGVQLCGGEGGLVLFVFGGEEPKAFPHFTVRLSRSAKKYDKAQQLRTLAPPPLGSFAFFFHSTSPPPLPTLDLFSGFAPPTFNPFEDLMVDSPLPSLSPVWN